MMFEEVFLAPRLKEVEKLKKLEEERMGQINDLLRNRELAKQEKTAYEQKKKIQDEKNLDLNHSNMENADTHSTMKRSSQGFFKTSARMIKMDDGGVEIMKEIEDSPERPGEKKNLYANHEKYDIIKIIMKKFNGTKKEEDKVTKRRPQTA